MGAPGPELGLGPAGVCCSLIELFGRLSFFTFNGRADPILLTLSLARYFDVLAGCRVA